ncbi:MAG: valine--tRNA ligase [Actinobacteria bacterium]|nr:valine--tRNA ligase [Actinomycetota bacterium]
MSEEILSKVYDPKETENKWYAFWLKKDYFHAVIDKNKDPFCIVIPPPNVTGSLHMGHALNNVLQDIVIRQKRMEGKSTLWLPGTDHAGIATQNVVEHQLAAEGVTRQDLGREKFIERVWKWKEQYGSTIINQLKRLGCSCDWKRERFTMDEGCSKAVREVFVKLYEEGLIYRGSYIINWCPRCHTALSDIEVEHQETEGSLWYIKYLFKDSDDYLTVATTRPETLLGDTAVAVSPNDERYKHLIGKTLILPVLKKETPLIADDFVDMKFGTGVVKVTPAHDPNDFEIGLRHNLPQVNIFTPDAKINENGGRYNGLDRYECRRLIIKDLEKEGLIEKIDKHIHSVGHCYRCNTIVEPYLSLQWFVKMKPLAEKAIKAVEDKKTVFVPSRWEKLYFDWMNNIRDWCISRQIWWGHRIPVWYCDDCSEVIVSTKNPENCGKCESKNLTQETDVLDTWFSSALWPFSTLGWPDETEDLKYFYPTSLLSTGFDIIFFWVARMMMMGLHFCGDVPFEKVYIHALIRDAEGKKMSKSRGNVMDPLDLIDEYGTDALRFTLASLAVPGRDVYLSEERIEGYRNFINKIWNASRFVLMNLNDFDKDIDIDRLEYTLADKWILSRLNQTIVKVEECLDKFNFSEAAYLLYSFMWSEFCDWYIELSKSRLYSKDDSPFEKQTAQYILNTVLDTTLRLLHPLIPFVTEEIWQKLPTKGESIMMAEWPKKNNLLIDLDVENKMSLIQDVISGIRKARSELNIPPSQKAKVVVNALKDETRQILKNYSDYVINLANLSDFKVEKKIERPEKSIVVVEHGIEIFILLADLIDFNKEAQRIENEIAKVKDKLAKIETKLSDGQFIEKAPSYIVEKKKQEREILEDKLKKFEDQMRLIK